MRFQLIILLLIATYSLRGQSIDASAAVIPDTNRIAANLQILTGEALSEIEVTAYGTPGQLKSTSGSVSVIPGDRLENSAASIASSFSAVPGVVVQEGTLGTIKLTLRGIGSRYPYGTKKIKLFFGEIPMYSAEGETTFDDINPEYISRIEVLRGPASSIHGASLGGTVILYPLRSEYDKENISLVSSAGSYGYFKNGVSYSNGTAKNDLFLSLSGIESGGFRENSRYSRYSFFVNHHQILSKTLSGNLVVSGSSIRSQIPSSVDSATFASNPQKAAANWLKTNGYEHPDRIFAGYSLHYKTPRSWDYSASAFVNSRNTEENRPFNFLDEKDFLFGGRILMQHILQRGGTTWQFMAGSNLFFEKVRSSLSENIGGNGIKGILQQDGKESVYQTDFFAQAEARMKRITITGGINFNRSGFRNKDQFSSDTLNQSGNYNFASILAPRIALTWNPMTNVYLYTSVNKGFSMPSLSETLSPLGLINREIKPEKAWSFEGGIRTNLPGYGTFIDLAFYHMRVTDLIVPNRVAEDIYVGMNAGSSIHRGIELAFQQWIIGNSNKASGHFISLIANLNYAYNRFSFRNFIQDNIDYSGKQLPGMPDQLFSGNLDLKLPNGFYTRFELTASGDIPLNDLNNQFSKGWVVMNLKGGYIFELMRRLKIDTTIKINNLADQKYASMVVVNAPGTASRPPRYFYPGLPRWFTCTVNITYQNSNKHQKFSTF